MDKENENEKLTPNQKLVLYFFIYSFVGWLLETAFCILTLGRFEKRGFLYGPLCPIYGFGAVILIKYIKREKNNYFVEFLISFIVFTIIEYIASLILEFLFGLRWWNYSNEFLNFQGRISLVYSILWGIMGFVFVEKIHPYINRKIEKRIINLNSIIIKNVLDIFIILILLDVFLSILKYMHFSFL